MALGTAVARLMRWAHGASFRYGEPDAFFETLLPLRDWVQGRKEQSPYMKLVARSLPVRRARSYASTYREHRRARDGGDTGAAWILFEDELFPT